MFALMLVLGFIATEGTVEYLLGVPFDKITVLRPHKWLLMYVSAALGVFLAFYYQIDPMTMLGAPEGPVGYAIAGVLMGRGANFVNDVWQRFFPNAGGRQ